ncbi:MAG: ABC transporter ATP-binding protein [Clostridiales bacterium]|nr:ABC transporter ATP-binding protein [Candidatus Crickella merdequi]
MLDFNNVTYSYPGGEPALNGISFHISDGEQIGLIGANGAGKSTLMKAALGLIGVQGTITACGLQMNKQNLSQIRKHLGYVLQNSDNQMFMPTVIEDMIFGPVNYGMSREEAEKVADKTLAQLGMEHLRDRHNHRMSGGEKRMAAIATILAMEPKLMLMDEPSAALDPRNRRILIDMLNQLPVTKIIASHDLDMILETCDRVILINDGQIVADGDTLTVLSNKTLLENNNLELPFCLAGIPMKKRPKMQ